MITVFIIAQRFARKGKHRSKNEKGAVSNAKIKAFEAAFFLFFCFSKEKIPHRDKKEHD